MSAGKRLVSPLKCRNENVVKKAKFEKQADVQQQQANCATDENFDLFGKDEEFDIAAFEAAEVLAKSRLNLGTWQRCRVEKVERDRRTFDLVLHVCNEGYCPTNTSDKRKDVAKCHLQGPWSHTRVAVNDVVSLRGEWDEKLQAFKVDKDEGFCVTNPDVLISGTSVVGSLFCRRKAVLQDRFRGIEGSNKVMVIGSLVHELLQTVLQHELKTLGEIKGATQKLLRSPDTAFMLYDSQLTRQETELQVEEFVPSIYRFLQQYVNESGSTVRPEAENFQGRISEIEDIEENLWVPQLGLKGKIDVSVRVHPRRHNRGKSLNCDTTQSTTVPLELKTGRSSFSMEHKGQLILYQMMLSATSRPTRSGLLLYLRDGLMREIVGARNEERDLIVLRNDLSYYLSSGVNTSQTCSENMELNGRRGGQPFELPEPISHPSACGQCAYATLCCSFAQRDASLELSSSHPLNKIMQHSTSHLEQKDYDYFIRWCHLLMLEEQEMRKANNMNALWTVSAEERQQQRRAICHLQLLEGMVKKEASHYLHTFTLSDSSVSEEDQLDLTLSGFAVGEYVIVSTQQRLAIASGTVDELKPSSISINLERNLYKKFAKQLFIVDKYESQSGNVFNFTNLRLLLDNTERSTALRRIIIDCVPPSFQKVLPKIVATVGDEILKKLNSIQRTAALKALTTQSYMLIKGLPGTGKTQTLVAIVRLLHLMGKSVLITSHTHSAVDNLLLRLKTHGLPILRLGSGSRVHPQLQDCSETVLTAGCSTESELAEIYGSFRIVGVTCLGSGHALFLHRRFDFCIVDESTQVMQPTVLRPLYFCERFILVGDPDQLPPLIRSLKARQLGADESLFTRLDSAEATSVLTLQYRMNKTITTLANKLTYGGALKCASDEVKLATIRLPVTNANTFGNEKWLQRALQVHVDQAVFLLDTMDCAQRSLDYASSQHKSTCRAIEQTFAEDKIVQCGTGGSPTKIKRLSKYTNYCEAAVVFHLVRALLKAGYDPDRIGIVAPYRAQVELLRRLAAQLHSYNQREQSGSVTLDFSLVEINTVDQYQGRDKDVILYSCSRTGQPNTCDSERSRDAEILEDKRRLTVAITRSKYKLIIVGDADCMQQYTPFRLLLESIPGYCKLKLEDDKLGFRWQSLLEELSNVICV